MIVEIICKVECFLFDWKDIIIFAEIEEKGCDPPCSDNAVCKNSSRIAECVCLDGYTGEDNCIGINVYKGVPQQH